MRSIVAALFATVALASVAEAREELRIVGSSTVYPFATTVAENFGRAGKFKTPIVESTGTGGGLKLFCGGIGEETADIATASRQIKPSETELCAKNGVKQIIETKIGYDGLVFGMAKKSPDFAFTTTQLFLGLARQVPQNGKLVDNPYKTWNEVDQSLPKEPILVYGPPPTSGTRDSLVELVMLKGCASLAPYKTMKEEDLKAACGAMREDGKYVEVGENDNLIIQRLSSNAHAIGVFGFSFLEENTDKIKAAKIGGLAPTFDDISDGSYPVARSMFLYTKKAHLGKIKGLGEYLTEFLSDNASGELGYLPEKGMIPLHPKELKAERKKLADSL